MFWIVVKYLLKLIAVVAPLASVSFVVSHCHDSAVLAWVFGPAPDKATVEKIVSVIFAGISVSGLTVHESIVHLWPRAQAKKFALDYVDDVLTQFSKSIEPLGLSFGQDLRVNVLFTRRCLSFPFASRFVWFTNRGFVGGQRDNGMRMRTTQGLCGQAYQNEQTLAVDLRRIEPSSKRRPCSENLWLFPWQRERTKHLKAIVSIPIFKRTKAEGMTRHKVVGVTNVDAVSDKGAEWLMKNAENLETFFGDRGTTLVWLSVR